MGKRKETEERNGIRTSSNVPYPHRLVETAGSEEVGLAIKVDAKHKVRVSLQNLDRCALRDGAFSGDKRAGRRRALQG